MKNLIYFCLPILCFVLLSCEKEEVDVIQEPSIVEIAYATVVPAGQGQEISVIMQKPTPCHTIVATNESTSGSIFNYDFILAGPDGDSPCAEVVQRETVKVQFDPAEKGEYTINFLVNGELYETRTVTIE